MNVPQDSPGTNSTADPRADAGTAATNSAAVRSPVSPAPWQQRVVLLGASNLSLSLPRILAMLPDLHSGPVDVLAAAGHGRSWCSWSRVWLRELPSITECGLWGQLTQLTASEPCPLTAVLTDVGNDLLYGQNVERILERVSTCLNRLTAAGASCVLTGLPLARIHRIGRWEFLVARSLLFPGSRLQHPAVLESAAQLDHGLRQLASRTGSRFVEPPGEWYGLDPIHIRHRLRATAWQQILTLPGMATAPTGQAPGSRPLQPGLNSLRPAVRRFAGKLQYREQPCYHSAGLRVYLY